jgi:antitoxin ParD1/3/4
MQVSLPPELEHFVESRVSAGEYQSHDAVVAAGLSLLQKRVRDREEALSGVRSKIRIGVEQADRGEVVDGEEYFRNVLGYAGS